MIIDYLWRSQFVALMAEKCPSYSALSADNNIGFDGLFGQNVLLSSDEIDFIINETRKNESDIHLVS